jgi:hypothetical protein
MKNKSAKRWLGVAAGSVVAMSASMAQAAIVETEGNDTFATANAGGNTTLIGNIGDASAVSQDVDIWSFQLAAGQAFTSSITHNGPYYNEFDVNPVMTLYWDNGGNYYPVASTDPQVFGTSINFTPWASGDYFVAVSADFNQGVDAYGNFQTDYSFLTDENILGTSFDHFNNKSFTAFGYEVVATGAVPVPAAVWLFGSGLLGLIGVARRRANKV